MCPDTRLEKTTRHRSHVATAFGKLHCMAMPTKKRSGRRPSTAKPESTDGEGAADIEIWWKCLLIYGDSYW